jgi:penicillin-binding protein 1A
MKQALASRPKLNFRVPDGVTVVRVGDDTDAYKAGQEPGVSRSLSPNGSGESQQLSAADTGAENVADEESDMGTGADTGSGQGMAAGSVGSTTSVDEARQAVASPANPVQPGTVSPGHVGLPGSTNGAPSAGGDIGMGGWY